MPQRTTAYKGPIAPGATEVAVALVLSAMPPEPPVVLRESVVFALSSVFAVSVVEEPARLSAGQVVMAEEAAGSVAVVVLPVAVRAPQG